MRIIAGKHKGRRIELPKEAGDIIRPTSDFAREAIFNILAHGKHGLNGHTFDDKNVLDVYCGTGALGLEALSRGAKRATFIDNAREALAAARYNAERMHETQVDFLQADATQLPKARAAYDIIFLDPPYFKGLMTATLQSLDRGGWIAEGALIVAEHDEKEAPALPTGFESVDKRKYGRAMVEILRKQ